MAKKSLVEDEGIRSARLLDAQAKAADLFAAIEPRGIIAPGVRETEASDAIRDLAADMFGVDRHWHKRIVRAGPNTLQPYRKNPPDRAIAADDIVFLDFGPVFERWEADFGRTYVLGDDPVKLRLRDALPVMFRAGRRFFEAHEDVTGEQLYAYMTGLAEADGWTFGGTIAGHLVGQFPHEKIAGEDIESYIAPGSDKPMRRTDRNGQVCHWILEVHLVDLDRQIGGFFEELLDLGPGPDLLGRRLRVEPEGEPVADLDRVDELHRGLDALPASPLEADQDGDAIGALDDPLRDHLDLAPGLVEVRPPARDPWLALVDGLEPGKDPAGVVGDLGVADGEQALEVVLVPGAVAALCNERIAARAP